MNRSVRVIAGAMLALAAAFLSAGPATAQDSATLKKIKETGTVTLGVREASSPFSFLDDKQQYERLCRFVEMFAPERIKDILYYNDAEPVFDAYGISRCPA